MVTKRFQQAIDSMASLGDPVRRRLYEAVVAEGRGISRNELAKATRVARPLVAYHLDRLVKDGLLAARFERQTGRTGPGAGRPAKLYYRPSTTLEVSLPPRDHGLIARVLLSALSRISDRGMRGVVDGTAREVSEELAREQVAGDGPKQDALRQILVERGYEPQFEPDGSVWLRNCVFHELAEQQRDLVCGMNLSLMRGVLQAVPGTGLEAKLEPQEGRCCVVLVPDETKDPDEDGA